VNGNCFDPRDPIDAELEKKADAQLEPELQRVVRFYREGSRQRAVVFTMPRHIGKSVFAEQLKKSREPKWMRERLGSGILEEEKSKEDL
jgi:hypothetical protein